MVVDIIIRNAFNASINVQSLCAHYLERKFICLLGCRTILTRPFAATRGDYFILAQTRKIFSHNMYQLSDVYVS